MERAFDRLVDLLKYSEELHMLKRLWNDEGGAIISAELVLVATILVIGMIVGLKSVRDAVVSELADVGQAIANINQSYRYGGVTGHFAQTMGSSFADNYDFCDLDGVTFFQSSRCTSFDSGIGVFENSGI
jgi:Flp pilus assembly pilin Flp